MTSLLDSYEQQYAVMNADFTAKIAKLSSSDRSDWKQIVQDLEKQHSEINELLEQMDLEVREVDPSLRTKYVTRMESYRTELSRLWDEFKLRSSNLWDEGFSDQNDSFGEINLKEEQKQRLLNSWEQVERSGNQLMCGYRILLETEDVGNQVLRNLHSQRETIQNSRSKLQETDAELNHGSKILSSIMMRSVRNSIVLVVVIIVLVIIFSWVIYYAVMSSS